MDSKDNTLFNNDILLLIKDDADDDYYYTDYEGNKIPSTDAIKKYSITNSKGKVLKPSIIKIDVVDNSYLEKILYQ